MYFGFHVKHPSNENNFSRRIFEKCSNVRFNKNPSSGGRVVPGRWTDRQTDMTKLIIAFRNFVNASKNGYSSIFPDMQLNASPRPQYVTVYGRTKSRIVN